MTEQEILELNQNEVYDELQKEFGQDALKEVGSFTQEFEMEVARRGLKQEYILHVKSFLGLPESFDDWNETDAWDFLRADLATRARAALLASHILD